MNSKGLCVLRLSVVGPSYISLTAGVVAGGGGDILSPLHELAVDWTLNGKY